MTAIYLHPGKKLGSAYELEVLLGAGQYGQVWRAKKLGTSKPVALKVPLDPDRGEDVLMADGRYMLEIPQHPGVVSVHWQGRVGTLWVVEMEFVNGPSLSRLMGDEARWAKVTFADIVRWFEGVASALVFLHNQKIAHGDLKPDNLLLDEPADRLKITDFGTSRRMTDNMMRTTRHAGAWAYQAPEILNANQRGTISDLYSIGAVMYHVLTGRLPRPTIHDLLTSAAIMRPRQFNPQIPQELDQLIMKLLADNPAQRLSRAEVLQTDLLALVRRTTASAVPAVQPLPRGVGYLDRATSLLAEGRREHARSAAAEATLHSTGLLPALELFGRLSEELGYMEDAIMAYRRLLSLEGVAAELRRSIQTRLGDLYLRLHRYEDAEQYAEAALANQTPSRDLLFKGAVVLGACTRLPRALELLDVLLTERPDDGAALEKKAWVLWLMHRYEDAAHTARRVLEIMPDSEMCLRRLVEYETLLGNANRADHYRRQLASIK